MYRKLAVTALLTTFIAGPAAAQMTTESVGSTTAYQAASGGMYYNHFEATATVELTTIATWLNSNPAESAEYFLYEATTAAGPYSRVYNWAFTSTTSNSIQGSNWVQYNTVVGNHYLVGVMLDDTNNGPGGLYTFLNAPGTATVSFGNFSGSGSDPYQATAPLQYTPPAFNTTALHRQNITWVPANYDPVPDAGGPYTTVESNPSVVLDASGTTDVDGDLDFYSWNCVYNLWPTATCGQTIHPVTSNPYTYSTLDDTVYTVQLRAYDLQGNWADAYSTVTVLNEAPTVTASCDTSCTVDEGDAQALTCLGTDPGSDPVIITWTYSDTGATTTGDNFTSNTTYTWADEGAFTATCLGDDLDGDTDTDVLNITVNNVAPTLGSVTSTPTANEGDSLPFTATATDPGVNDVLTYTWDWGDGTNSSGPTANKQYLDEGSFTTSVTVADGDGGTDTSAPVVVAVSNVAPVVSLSCPATLEEGEALNLQVTMVDPGADAWLWTATGAPAALTITPSSGAEFATVQWTPSYADIAAGTFGFSVTVDDQDGGVDTASCSGISLTYIDVDLDGLPDTWETTHSVTDPAGDPDMDGRSNTQEFGDSTDPNVFDGPDAPVATSPINGDDAASVTPTLTWTNATSPVSDPLTYAVEVYEDFGGVALLASGTATEAATSTSWTVDVAIPDNQPAFWRVQAADGYVSGAWTDMQSMFIDVVNEPPGTPVLVSPAEDSIIAELAPLELKAQQASDPEGDPNTVSMELYSDEALTELVDSVTGLNGFSHDPAIWDTATPPEDARYWWRAQAIDDEGAASAWAGPWTFVPSSVDDPPPAPTFVWPIDGGQSELLMPVFELVDGGDPELLEATFEIEMSTDSTFMGDVPSSGGLPEDAPGELTWDSSVAGDIYTEDMVGYARARSSDPGGLASDWTVISFTPNVQNDPPTAPTLLAPIGGEEVEGEVELRIRNATDPDGARRTYEFEVSQGGAVVWTGEADEEVDETWVLIADNELDAGEASWRARALDDLALEGPWAGPETFLYVIPVIGDDDDDAADDDDSAGDTDGCDDCESSLSGGTAGWWMLGLIGLAGRRRRG